MSATSFKAADLSVSPWIGAKPLPRWTAGVAVDIALLGFCLAMLALMRAWEGAETVPYHFLFLSVALVYGFRVWPLLPTVVVIVAITGSTGLIMYGHYRAGAIDSASELAEVPLMPALLVAMVWHARRRAAAQRQTEVMADERRASLEREREFFRDTSHAIRTPVTIARGHLELIEPTLTDDLTRQDVGVALRQMDRMSALSNRLLALAQLDAGIALRRAQIDLCEFVDEIGKNWSNSADRHWVVTPSAAAPIWADAEWLALALDAIIENAVHFTKPGDRIVIAGRVNPDSCVISVADSGPGIDPGDLPQIFERFWHRRPPGGEMGSGLGLPIALATARAHGGLVTAANQRGGGACFELTLPNRPAA
jgi:signal transduction histidine kinase